MPEISRTHLRHISSLELALIRYTQVTCHMGTKQTQSTPYKDTRKRSVAQTTTSKKIGQIHRKEDTVLPQKVNTRQKHKTKIPKFNSTRKAKIPNNECGHAKCVVLKHQKLRRPHIPKSRLHLTLLLRSSLDLSFMSERMHSLRKKVHRFAVFAVSSVRVQIGADILEAPCSGEKMCLYSGEFP